jgi:hypothetical protein
MTNEVEQEKRKNKFLSTLLDRLNSPARFRVFVMGVVLLAGYCLMYLPLNDQIAQTSEKLRRAQATLQLAREVESLQKQYSRIEARLPVDAAPDEWKTYVMEGCRKFPSLKLTSMTGEAPRSLGLYRAVVLRIGLEGEYNDLDNFLWWLESNQRLFRVDSLSILPVQQRNSPTESDSATMQILLLGLMG